MRLTVKQEQTRSMYVSGQNMLRSFGLGDPNVDPERMWDARYGRWPPGSFESQAGDISYLLKNHPEEGAIKLNLAVQEECTSIQMESDEWDEMIHQLWNNSFRASHFGMDQQTVQDQSVDMARQSMWDREYHQNQVLGFLVSTPGAKDALNMGSWHHLGRLDGYGRVTELLGNPHQHYMRLQNAQHEAQVAVNSVPTNETVLNLSRQERMRFVTSQGDPALLSDKSMFHGQSKLGVEERIGRLHSSLNDHRESENDKQLGE